MKVNIDTSAAFQPTGLTALLNMAARSFPLFGLANHPALQDEGPASLQGLDVQDSTFEEWEEVSAGW